MQILDQLYMTTEGLFGIPLSVSATYVMIFVLFGSFMERTGMASRVVTARLRTLEALGLFARVAYQMRPLRHEYRC